MHQHNPIFSHVGGQSEISLGHEMYINDRKLRNGEDVAGSHPISVEMGDFIFKD